PSVSSVPAEMMTAVFSSHTLCGFFQLIDRAGEHVDGLRVLYHLAFALEDDAVRNLQLARPYVAEHLARGEHLQLFRCLDIPLDGAAHHDRPHVDVRGDRRPLLDVEEPRGNDLTGEDAVDLQ